MAVDLDPPPEVLEECLAAVWMVQAAAGWRWSPALACWAAGTAKPPADRVLQPACDDAEHVLLSSRRLADLKGSLAGRLESLAAASPHLGPLQLAQRVGQEHAAWQNQRRPQRRAEQGVYYTPWQLAWALTAWADWAWTRHWPGARGVLDADSDGPRILDPACGGGMFFAAAIQLAHQRCLAEGRDWPTTAESLLPRLQGCDLALPSVVLSHLVIAVTLAATGYTFPSGVGPRLLWGDALQQPVAEQLAAAFRGVIVGNPPFRALTGGAGRWMQQLLRGHDGGREPRADYLAFQNQTLGERKHWLHDDYVQFIRLCHWLVERRGEGVAALVANHSFLDNASFRLLRRWLAHDFSVVHSLDLHGNVKKGETRSHPRRSRDQNVFAIEQGVACCLWVRPPRDSNSAEPQPAGDASRVTYSELWGDAESKLARLQAAGDAWLERRAASTPAPHQGETCPNLLAAAAPLRDARPLAPHYLWTPQDPRLQEAFQRGAPLPELMPYSASAPVTARDGVVVAFSRGQLLARLQRLADLAVPEEAIRLEFFASARSRRYPPGDTRGWKLEEARRRLAAESPEQREAAIRPCLYRPGDVRWVYWRPWMIDWPREELERRLSLPGNWLLITRRRMLPGSANFIWASRHIALDGVLRSDNRGNETMFPWLVPGPEAEAAEDGVRRAAFNLHAEASRRLAAPAGAAPPDLVAFLYGQMHAGRYQARFGACLEHEYPRLFPASSGEAFAVLRDLGSRLLRAHLAASPPAAVPPEAERVCGAVASGYPRHRDGVVWISRTQAAARVSAEAWEHRIGGHQVLRKWLKDRRGQPLYADDLRRYRALAATVQHTRRWVRKIDAALDQGALRW